MTDAPGAAPTAAEAGSRLALGGWNKLALGVAAAFVTIGGA